MNIYEDNTISYINLDITKESLDYLNLHYQEKWMFENIPTKHDDGNGGFIRLNIKSETFQRIWSMRSLRGEELTPLIELIGYNRNLIIDNILI